MKPDPQREPALFQAAAQLTGAARASFLDNACAGNSALRQRLEALLAAYEQTDGVLADSSPTTTETMKTEFSDAPDETVGQRIGRYKILECVGEGGCGVVYVAEQAEPVRRRVALKVIKLGMDTKQVTPPCACASAKQPVDPLDQRDHQRCLSPARFYRDVWT